MSDPRDVGVIVVAAGRSTRLGGDLPKVYHPLAGEPVLVHSLRVIAGCGAVGAVAVVIRPEDRERAETLLRTVWSEDRPAVLVDGGAERHDSVRAGLQAVAASGVEIVLVHDAARPRATRALFERVIDGARTHGAVVPGVPVVDTLKRRLEDGGLSTVPRDELFAIQTPQGFQRSLLERAHDGRRDAAITDDAMMVEALGVTVRLVEGERNNRKLTYAEDFRLLDAEWSTD